MHHERYNHRLMKHLVASEGMCLPMRPGRPDGPWVVAPTAGAQSKRRADLANTTRRARSRPAWRSPCTCSTSFSEKSAAASNHGAKPRKAVCSCARILGLQWRRPWEGIGCDTRPHDRCLLACLPACLFAYLLACLPAYRLARLPACLLACLPACLPACLLACLRACVPACLPACLQASKQRDRTKKHQTTRKKQGKHTATGSKRRNHGNTEANYANATL